MTNTVCILIPVYNDWEGLEQILGTFTALPGFSELNVEFLIVDDGSSIPRPSRLLSHHGLTRIRLNSNIGHQKAIAVGLAYLHASKPDSPVMVMDADGQDRPEDALGLYNLFQSDPQRILVASRARRPEGIGFRLYYFIFKQIFRMLSGRKLRFGNFSVLPPSYVGNLVYRNELWSHYAATLLKSDLPIREVPIPRAPRKKGESRMSFGRLLLHGMGAFLVFLDRISVKLSYFSVVMAFASLLVALIILCIRIFTELAIPGWASTLLTSMLILFMQSFLLGFFTLFLYLNAQTQKQFIPALHYRDYILDVEAQSHEFTS